MIYSPRWRLVLQTEISVKCKSSLYFVLFIYFFYHFSSRKDQFTVLRLKFGTQDFTDPDPDPAVPHWFVFVDLSSQAVNEHGEQINKTGTNLNLNPSSISDFISNSQLCSYFSFSLSPCSKGSLSNHDGNGRGNIAQKLNSRCFKLHCYYLNSFNFQLRAIFFSGVEF